MNFNHICSTQTVSLPYMGGCSELDTDKKVVNVPGPPLLRTLASVHGQLGAPESSKLVSTETGSL